MREFADSIEWWLILGVGVAAFWFCFEVGLRQGRKRRHQADQDEKSQVNIISTTLLGLLGLLLAFSLDMVEERYQNRKMLVVRESNAIGTAYLRAGMIPEPHGTRVRGLLRQYVDGRLGVSPENFEERVQQATTLQHALWTQAEAIGNQQPDSEIVSLFVQSLNDVIELHQERLVNIFHRLPNTILGVLFVVSFLAIGGLGYSWGLTDSRSRLPTFLIILAIMVVETVIVDLDRPLGGLFQVSQDAMIQLQETVFDW